MKIQINNETVLEIAETEIKILGNSYSQEQLREQIENSIKWNIESMLENTRKRFRDYWLPILFERYETIPTKEDLIFKLIFSQPDYKSKEQRDFEEKAQNASSFQEE